MITFQPIGLDDKSDELVSSSSKQFSFKKISAKSVLSLFFVLLLSSLSTSLFAQVSIGGGIPPQESVLLELKDYEPDADNTTSTKGFMMTRVKLEGLTSLSPIIADSEVTESIKKNNVGLQVYHVGGNNMTAGVKVWNGVSWSSLDNSSILANNGITNNADTIQLGGTLTKATKLTSNAEGANFEFNATSPNTNMLITGNAKVGINTATPQSTLDVNGDLIVRGIPVLEDGFFTDIGVNEYGKVYKRNDSFTSYSVYLGFDPMAITHTDTIPVTFQYGYMYRIEGISIGACEGTLVYFTVTLIGTRYVGATLQAVATRENSTTVYPPVTLTASQPIFNVGQSLEYLAGNTGCGSKWGHTLTYLAETNQIVVDFLDDGTYFKDAGTFAITNLVQLSILGTDQVVE